MKSDANAKRIYAHARSLGATVVVHDPERRNGKSGEPDAFIGFMNKTIPVEVKMPGKWLNEEQEKFHRDWKGSPIWIVRTEVDLECALGLVP